jgi:hypothetical protein
MAVKKHGMTASRWETMEEYETHDKNWPSISYFFTTCLLSEDDDAVVAAASLHAALVDSIGSALVAFCMGMTIQVLEDYVTSLPIHSQ